MSNFETQKRPFVQMSLPLHWLLSSFVLIVLSIGGLFVKMDFATKGIEKLETKLDRQDDKVTLMLQQLQEEKGINSRQDAQLQQLQAYVLEVSRRLDIDKKTR